MKFECDSCHAQYMIADEKVGSRGVKVKCKRCSHVIIVRPADVSAAEAGAREPGDDGAGAVPASASSLVIPAAPGSGGIDLEGGASDEAPPEQATDEEDTGAFASEDDDDATLAAPPPFGASIEAMATKAAGGPDETQVGPRPDGLSGLDEPSAPDGGDQTEVGAPELDDASEAGRSAGEEDAAPPPPPSFTSSGFDDETREFGSFEPGTLEHGGLEHGGLEHGGLDDSSLESGALPPEPPAALPPLAADDAPAMPPVEEPPPGADALDEQIAGAFSNMFDASAAPSDIPEPPPLDDDGPGARGPTVVLDLGQVEKLRRESARTEMNAPLVDPGFDASLDDVRADLDASLDGLGGAAVAPPSPWGDDAHASQHTAVGQAPDVSDEPEWHVAIDDEDVGPLTLDEVGEHIAAGRVDRESLVWRSGMGDWEPAEDVPSIRALFDRVPLPRITTPPEPAAAPRTSSRLDAGASLPDLAPSPFGGPGAGDPFSGVPDMGGDPAWQPHGLTDVYQAANLAEAAAGLAAANTPAKSAPDLRRDEEEPVEWKPGAASALASLVQEEIKRIDSAPEEGLAPPPADDAGIGGFGDLSGPDAPAASAAGLSLGGLPPLSGVDLAGPQMPAGASGQAFPYPPVSSAGLPGASGQLPAMSGQVPALSGQLPAAGGALPPMAAGMPPMPYAPVPPPSRPVGLYAGIGAGVVVLLLLTAAVVKIAFFGSPAAPTVAGAPTAPPAPAAPPAQPPQPPQPTPPAEPAVATAPEAPAADATAPGAAATPPAAEPPSPEEPAAEPVAPAEPVKVAMAEPKRDDKPKAKEPKETRPSRAAKKSRDDDRRKSRAEERKKRRARAEEPPKKATRSKKGCDPVLDFDCDEKPRRSRASSGPAKETLSRTDVLLVVRKNLGGVNACLKRHNDKGPVKMEWRIAKSGRTTGVKVLSSKHAGTPVGNCLVGEIKGWRFPSYSGKAPPPVKFPFKL